MRIRSLSAFVVSSCLAVLPVLSGCTAGDDASIEGDEQALTEAKVLARGVTSPSGLAVSGSHVYFGANRFIASGDPELDQQFAYWEGKFSRVPLAGGKQEIVAEIGPITAVKASGAMLYYGMSQGCWISRLDTAAAGKPKSETVYEFADCDPEVATGLAYFELAADKLYVVEDDGTLIRANADGKSAKKIGAPLIPGHGGIVATGAIADGAMYIATNGAATDDKNKMIPAALYRVTLGTGATTKVMDLPRYPSEIVSDGTNLFWAEGETLKRFRPGAAAAEDCATGFGAIVDLAVDGTSVFVADAKRGAVYLVADAAGAAANGPPKAKKKLAAVKGIQDIVAANGTLYVGSHVVEGRKAAGIIGAIQLTPR